MLVVGGAVRDLLMGVRPVDLDLMVEGPVAALATELGGDQLRLHDRFSTATIELEGSRCDIAQARREVYPAPGALPEVEPASAAEDLRRRDFTVNAIALVVTGANRGELLFTPDGLSDIEQRLLRVLHELSFSDDPTRLLRLARYAARLRFGIEARTLALARRAVREGALLTVSGARIGNELRLLASESDPVAACRRSRSWGSTGRSIRSSGSATPPCSGARWRSCPTTDDATVWPWPQHCWGASAAQPPRRSIASRSPPVTATRSSRRPHGRSRCPRDLRWPGSRRRSTLRSTAPSRSSSRLPARWGRPVRRASG